MTGPEKGGSRGTPWRRVAASGAALRALAYRHARRASQVGAVLLALAGVALWVNCPAPRFDAVRRAHLPSEQVLLSQEGEVLQTVRVNKQVQRDAWVPLADIAPALRSRLLKAEDKDFYAHGAVDWAAAASAGVFNLVSLDGRRGASTLAMQTVDVLQGVRKGKDARSWASKLRQVVQAYRLEAAWSKDEILEAYLNEVSFRGELTGVAAASRFLFSKSPSTLSDDEATLLAVLVRAPQASLARVVRRYRLLQESLGVRVPAEDAEAFVLQALPRKEGFGQVSEAPHLAHKLLVDQPMATGALTASVQAPLQRAVNRLRDERLQELQGRNVADAAVVVLDNRTGQVLAYAGTSSMVSTTHEVDTASALRQAGSTLKPFIYGLAIETQKLTAASLLADEPLAEDQGAGVYAPQNYDRKFRGLVSVRTALGSSLNIPAVKALQIAGADAVNDKLREVGLEVPREADFYGEGLALGSLDVTLLTLTNAYRTLANGGIASPVCFLKGCAASEQAQVRAFSAPTAWVLGHLLSDNNARATTFGLDSSLRTPYWTAVKTGTSKDMRDNWALGYSRRYTVGVWVGNAKGDPMHDVSGVSGAAPLWRDIMDRLHAEQSSEPPAVPPGVVVQRVRYAPAVEAEREDVFLAGTQRAVVEALSPLDTLAAGQVQIRNPVDHSRLAWDPDIPAAYQRVVFEANVTRDLVWRLDGKVLTSLRGTPVRWAPVRGAHVLEVLDATQRSRVLDTVHFEVRAGR